MKFLGYQVFALGFMCISCTPVSHLTQTFLRSEVGTSNSHALQDSGTMLDSDSKDTDLATPTTVDAQNSANAAILVDDVKGTDQPNWTSDDIEDASNYPMIARIDLGKTTTINSIELFHNDGEPSSEILVSYLPVGSDASSAESFTLIENHSDEVQDDFATVNQTRPIETQTLQLTITSPETFYSISELRINGTSFGGAGRPNPTPTVTPPASGNDFKIVIIGSSTAEGHGASDYSQSWVSKMYADLNSVTGSTLVETNLALGGLSSSDLMTNGISDRNITKALSYNPDLVIVALAGGNDFSNGVDKTTFFSNLDNIKAAARAKQVPLFFTGLSPKDFNSYSDRQAMQDWNQALQSREQSCFTPGNDQYSSCFMNVYPGLANSNLQIRQEYASNDGIHLNDQGHAYYESVAFPVIKAYVCSKLHCLR